MNKQGKSIMQEELMKMWVKNCNNLPNECRLRSFFFTLCKFWFFNDVFFIMVYLQCILWLHVEADSIAEPSSQQKKKKFDVTKIVIEWVVSGYRYHFFEFWFCADVYLCVYVFVHTKYTCCIYLNRFTGKLIQIHTVPKYAPTIHMHKTGLRYYSSCIYP